MSCHVPPPSSRLKSSSMSVSLSTISLVQSTKLDATRECLDDRGITAMPRCSSQRSACARDSGALCYLGP